MICSDDVEGSESLKCKKADCGYGAHEACAAVLADLNGVKLCSSRFCCEDVNYYIKPSEVDELAESSVENLKSIRTRVTKRGVINTKLYTPKRKRYQNPNLICRRCGETIGINEEDHLLAYCSASFASTPIPTRDFEYVSTKFKRIRRMAIYDYPP